MSVSERVKVASLREGDKFIWGGQHYTCSGVESHLGLHVVHTLEGMDPLEFFGGTVEIVASERTDS